MKFYQKRNNKVILFIHNFVFIRLCLEFPKLHKWSEKITYEAIGINFMNKQVTKSHDSEKYFVWIMGTEIKKFSETQ